MSPSITGRLEAVATIANRAGGKGLFEPDDRGSARPIDSKTG